MNNYEIADQFALQAKLMDLHGENSFKSKSYSNAAFNIERLPAEISTMTDAELFGVRGIGESTGKKIRELLHTGTLPQLTDILAATPAGILDMLQIKGLGPKKIGVIWQEMGVESLGELEYACNENRLVALKGFGAKTQESVLQNIMYFKQNLGFHLWAEVEQFGNAMINQLEQAWPGNRFALTGNVRRQNETVEYVDIVTDMDKQLLLGAFATTEGVVTEEKDGMIYVHLPNQPRIRFHVSDKDAFHHTLFATTATPEFLDAFKQRFTMPDAPANEEAIFAANGLTFIPAMLRETAEAITRYGAMVPDLVQPAHIRGIIHSHSTWSDGVHTIKQMAEAAIAQGLEYLVLSDHSQTAFYAGGLKPEQVAAQHQEIDALNARLAPFKIFKSIESDILSDGSLDYSDQVLATFDLVIASVHSNLKMSQEKAMDRVLTAIRNPYTRILGHPTGRLLLSRKGYPLDHKAVIDACAAHNVVLEINAHPRRLDLDWRWIEYAVERGVLLSIDPDAHSTDGYRDTYYGVKIAQKGGLTARQNLSSYTLQEFEAFLKSKQGSA